LLALAAAVLHASWNLALKRGSGDRFVSATLQFAAGGLLFMPALFITGLPAGQSAGWLGLSTGLHLFYVLLLVRAYGAGDFSLAYPLARGSGALLAALGGAVLLGDTLPPVAVAGIAVATAGLFSLVGRGASPPSYGWATLTGVLIGAYTLVDTVGARHSSGAGYAISQGISVGVVLGVVCLALGRGASLVSLAKSSWRRHAAAGAASVAAYSLVLMAVRLAPVGYVAVLRESSVVLGAMGGWWLLKERMARRRAVSAVVILAGMGVLVAAR
jgi:drug/metabolite transporter (DMT)-like permease